MKIVNSFLICIWASLFYTAFAASDRTLVCTRQLEGIVYSPDNFYKDYLFKLLDELIVMLDVFNAVSEVEIVPIFKEFAAKYDITIISQPSIGRKTTFTGTSVVPSLNRIYGQIVAPPYINFRGFNYNPETATYQASAQASGANGAVNTIIITKSWA